VAEHLAKVAHAGLTVSLKNDKCQSFQFPNLYTVLNAVIIKLCNFDAWWTAWKHQKPV